jgi:hypothetical protein
MDSPVTASAQTVENTLKWMVYLSISVNRTKRTNGHHSLTFNTWFLEYILDASGNVVWIQS